MLKMCSVLHQYFSLYVVIFKFLDLDDNKTEYVKSLMIILFKLYKIPFPQFQIITLYRSGEDEIITNVLNTFDIYIVAVMNMDGFEYSHTDV